MDNNIISVIDKSDVLKIETVEIESDIPAEPTIKIINNQPENESIEISTIDTIDSNEVLENVKPISNSNNTNKFNIILCFFGVISRSIRYTFPNINKTIIQPIKKKGFNLDIFGFNLNAGKTLVDGKLLNNKDARIVPFTHYKEELQSKLDRRINYSVKLRKVRHKGIRGTNAIRQMYSESKIAEFLKKSKKKYHKVIVCGPDFSFHQSINTKYLLENLNKHDIIYTTSHRDCGGYTNGFYIGTPKALIPVLNRYHTYNKHLKRKMNYESILRLAFKYNKKKRVIINMPFDKIRSTGKKKIVKSQSKITKD